MARTIQFATASTLLIVGLAIVLPTRSAVGAPEKKPGAKATADRSSADSTAADSKHAAVVFEVYQDKAGDYRWRLRAKNTRILATSSEGYSEKRACLSAIESVKRAAADAPVEEKSAPKAAEAATADSENEPAPSAKKQPAGE